MKFYKCPVCGNIIIIVEGNDKTTKCCGKEMEVLMPNKVDASLEKHVPVYEKSGDYIKVIVGEVEHPMTDEHYIMFIAQVVGNNITIVNLNPGDIPEAKFKYIKGSKIYAYCNLHGLWVNELN